MLNFQVSLLAEMIRLRMRLLALFSNWLSDSDRAIRVSILLKGLKT
jgi:hypothetical protein